MKLILRNGCLTMLKIINFWENFRQRSKLLWITKTMAPRLKEEKFKATGSFVLHAMPVFHHIPVFRRSFLLRTRLLATPDALPPTPSTTTPSASKAKANAKCKNKNKNTTHSKRKIEVFLTGHQKEDKKKHHASRVLVIYQWNPSTDGLVGLEWPRRKK